MFTFQYKFFRSKFVCASVADPDPFDTNPDPDPAFHFDIDPDPDPTFKFDLGPDPTVLFGSGSLLFQRGNVPRTVLFIHPYLIFLVGRSNRIQPEGILC